MTVVLNYLSRYFAVSVSDRLVSVDGRPHDDRFNKALAFIGDDGPITIAFTGIARIRGLPTDEWIAKAILGERYLPRVAIRFPRRRLGPNTIRAVVSRVVTALRSELDRGPSALTQYPLDVLVSGIQRGRSGLSPYGLIVSKPDRARTLSFRLALRGGVVRDPEQFPLSISGRWDAFEPSIARRLVERLEPAAIDTFAAPSDYVAEVLLHGLREFAATRPNLIGNEAMIVSHHPLQFESSVRFEPLLTRYEPILGGMFGEVPVSYSPWIIATGTYAASSEFVSEGHVLELSGTAPDGTPAPWRVHIRGLPQDPGRPKMLYIVPLRRNP